MILAQSRTGISLVDYIKIRENDIDKYEPISSAYAIIKVDNKLLLGFNTWRKQWEFPAGKLEKGETAKQAAVRELFEETHQDITGLAFKGLFKIYDTIQKEERYRAVFYSEVDRLEEFKRRENDEMSEILLWDRKEDIGYIDEVDVKMLEMIIDYEETSYK